MTRRSFSTSRSVWLAVAAHTITSVLPSSPALAEPRADTVSRPPATGAAVTPAGERLPTDEPLRKGMAAIRTLVHHHHSLVTHRRLPPATAVTFAAQVRNEADTIAAKSAVPGQSAVALKPILGKLVDGAEAVAGRKTDISQMDGIFLMDEALGAYGAHFDDPGWK